MKKLFTLLLVVSSTTLAMGQTNQTNLLQTRKIWADGREYPAYTGFYLFPSNPFPKCGEFDIVKTKAEYAENVKHIKEKYPNARFREVVIQYQPSKHEVELTFEQFQKIICK